MKAGDKCPECGYEPLEDDGMIWCPGCDAEWEPDTEGSEAGDRFPDED